MDDETRSAVKAMAEAEKQADALEKQLNRIALYLCCYIELMCSEFEDKLDSLLKELAETAPAHAQQVKQAER